DNILQFKNLYPNCRIFKLERNYRSTQNIVNAANSLIHKNEKQIHKTVYSEKEAGDKVTVFSTYSDYEEGYAVASKIKELLKNGAYTYADFAILYRTNAQSRTLEEALRKRNIPYKIYGGLSFYQRKEIKDIISYFRLIVNPHDEEAFKRVINYPSRGIGDTTVGKLTAAANRHNVSLWTILQAPLEYNLPINNGTAKKLQDFQQMMGEFMDRNKSLPAEEIATVVVKESGILRELMSDNSVEGISKKENLEELLKGIVEFSEIRREEGIERVMLADFLSEIALLTDQDNDKEEQTDKVTMMTVHAAKGLEFPNVFVVGLEEDLFPSQMSKGSQREIEEERRLFYVALTRAEQNCILTYSKSRFRNGQTTMAGPSRFLKDIDAQYLDLPTESSASDVFTSARKQYGEPAFKSPFQQPQPIKENFTSPVASHSKSRLKRIPNTDKPNIADNTSTTSPINLSGLETGTKVRHERFGDGIVVLIEGEGSNAKATVNFTHFGQKNLLLKYAKLTIVS
ncbi:ATP-binding domain-containing protein, partial [Parabacteroides sp. OttesenSCG-928-G21]|nr:ATP-binding domain-containing protein [Parabacteroides sp. OttesenSCG-928-G21]